MSAAGRAAISQVTKALDTISLVQTLVALTSNVGVMNENVGAVIAPDKSCSPSNLQST